MAATRRERIGQWAFRAVEVVLRVSAGLLGLAFVALLIGSNGLGWVDGTRVPGAPRDAVAVMHEPVTLREEPALAALYTAGQRLGALEARINGSNDQAGAGGRIDFGEINGPVGATATFWTPSGAMKWAWLLVRIVPVGCLAVGMWVMAGLTRTARAGDPFVRGNVRRLALLTGLVAVGGLTADWGTGAVRQWLVSTSDIGPVATATSGYSGRFVVLTLLLAVLTAVWRRGVALREDLAGPV